MDVLNTRIAAPERAVAPRVGGDETAAVSSTERDQGAIVPAPPKRGIP
jgi:hypothetical protein